MRVLTVNAGSSSLKLALLDPVDRVLGELRLDGWDGADEGPISDFAAGGGPPDAVAHRVVHGGRRYRGATLLDEEVLAGIALLATLAPLHQTRAVAGIEAARRALGRLPQVACFDTSFHASLPTPAATYPLPLAWRERWDLRRYGFHGLSHAYASRRAADLTGRDPSRLKVVSCHLGSGASVCAVSGGRSVDTTMGFTPLEGVVMATRSGSVDPGMLLWIMERDGLTPRQVSEQLESHSGLAGLSGGSGDMREVVASAAHDPRCALALAVYCHRLRQAIAAMAASLGGLDVLVFTGGVGENQPGVRSAAAEGLGFLGIGIDPSSNARASSDSDVTAPGAPVTTLVVSAREDAEMARQARSLLGG